MGIPFRNLLVFVACVCALLTGSGASAQNNDPCGCDAALAKDVFSLTHSKEKEVAFLKIIDQKTFEEAKSKGGFGVSIPVVDAILNASANWADFNTKRTSYFQSIGYNASEKESMDVFISATSAIAYSAWAQCKQNCALSHTGLTIWKESEDRDSIVVSIFFQAPVGVSKVKLTGNISNGSTQGLPGGNLVPANTFILASEKKSFLITRKDRRSRCEYLPTPPDMVA